MKLLVSLFLISFSTLLSAQVLNPEFQKLFDLYIMNKYEKCHERALKIIEKGDHRSEPEPYVYAAMSELKLADDIDDFKERSYAIKKALKFGTKYAKYKNKSEDPYSYDVLYENDLTRFAQVSLGESKYYYHEGKTRKAAYYAKLCHKLKPDQAEYILLDGLGKLLARNHRLGMEMVEQSRQILKTESREFEGELEIEMIYNFLVSLKEHAHNNTQTSEYHILVEELSDLLPTEYAEKIEKLDNVLSSAG